MRPKTEVAFRTGNGEKLKMNAIKNLNLKSRKREVDEIKSE